MASEQRACCRAFFGGTSVLVFAGLVLQMILSATSDGGVRAETPV